MLFDQQNVKIRLLFFIVSKEFTDRSKERNFAFFYEIELFMKSDIICN